MKNKALILYIILQILFLSLSVFLFTSTIEIFPWYEPLTMGAFMILMLVAPIQLLISLIFRNLLTVKSIIVISHINSSILVSALLIGIFNQDLFYPLAKLFSIAECLLMLGLMILPVYSRLTTRK